MGQVYRARDTNLGRYAAIKVLPDAFLQDPERLARFHREAKVLASLSHPNIAAVYGWEQCGASSALVMELVEGHPLSELIPRKGMPLDKAIELSIQIARGLEAAHRAGVVHRDLKPSNVMVTAGGVVKLLDFGLATYSAPASAAGSLEETATAAEAGTAEGNIVGTIAYMSPEQAQGKPLDARSDLFSFGTMFFEMLTGKRPFRGDNQVSTMAAILREEPQAVSSLVAAPHELDRLIGRCLRKSAERRFQTASDLRLALEDLAEEASSGQLSAAPSPTRSGLWRVAAAAAVVAITALAATLYFTRHQTLSAPRVLRQLTFESGMALMPALSRDGKLLVYASDRAGEGTLDLWIRQTAGGDPHRLTSSMGVVSNPQFSPDGTRVLFLSGSSIFEIPTLGGQTRRLVDNAGPFTVSSLGEIAFVTSLNGIPAPIMIVPAAGSEPHQWRSDCAATAPPGWSPEGQRLAMIGRCGKNDYGIFIAPRQGGTLVRIPGNADDLINRFPPTPRIQWYPALERSTEALISPRRNGDSINIFRIAMDGTFSPITQGTGREADVSVSGNGEMVFTRAEYHPSIWSLPLETKGGAPVPPKKEASPAALFTVSRDGSKLVFGRIAGLTQGELVVHDMASRTETVIASHAVTGIGSFWCQLSPDGGRVIYRLVPRGSNVGPPFSINQCLVSLGAGAPRCLETQARFNLGSGWRPDGSRIVGECEKGAICEMDPSDWSVRQIVPNPPGSELLYPSYSWDGKWMTFMQRGGGVTAIAMARVRDDGSLVPQPEWVRVSPPEIRAASRPRFTQDGKSIFYIRNEGGVQHLVRQRVDPASGRPLAAALDVAPVQIYAAWFADSLGSPPSTVQVSTTRVFFNSVELRGNVWATRLY
jgi:serine/threonine protein kinase